MEIFIPTLRRGNRQVTWNSLPGSVQKNTKLLIDSTESTGYENYPHVVLPSEINGIGRVRQWVIDNSVDKVIMLDDDLTFAIRRRDDATKFVPASERHIEDMFGTLFEELDEYAHAGVASREGANRNTELYIDNTRLLRILAYRADILRKEEIRFDRVPVMEDFDVALQLLRKGYASRMLNWIVQNQGSSNAPGGCSTYRTLEIQKIAAESLAALHPEFVTTVVKKTKTAWNGQERTDVRVQWQRAFRSAGKIAVLDQRKGKYTPL